MDGWIVVERCPLCDGALKQHAQTATAPYLMVDFIGGPFQLATVSSFKKCAGCGLIIQSPRLTDERLCQYYQDGTYRATLGIEQGDADRDEEKRATALVLWLELQGIKPKSHLDVGCGRGYFLRLMWAQGADVLGYEPFAAYTLPGIPTCAVVPDRTFELVSLIHVLEHEPDPLAMLKRKAAHVAPGGWMLVEVPGEKCLGGPLRFAHLFQFPASVLSQMLWSAGLTVEVVEQDPNVRILARK